MKKILWLCVVVMFLSSFTGLATASAETALKKVSNDLIGIRYKFGGSTTRGFDCSGLISHVYKKFGVKLPRSSRSMATVGKRVQKAQLKSGDLVFFKEGRSKRISHVGVYVGNGKFIHSSSKRGVVQDNMKQAHWVRNFVMARRVLSKTQMAKMNSETKTQLASAKKVSTSKKKSVVKLASKKKSNVIKKATKKKTKAKKSIASSKNKSSAKLASNKTKATTKKLTAKKASVKKANVKKAATKKKTVKKAPAKKIVKTAVKKKKSTSKKSV